MNVVMSYRLDNMDRRDSYEGEAKRQRFARPVPIQYSESPEYQMRGPPPVSMAPDQNALYNVERTNREIWNQGTWGIRSHPPGMAPPSPFHPMSVGPASVPTWQERPDFAQPLEFGPDPWMEVSRSQPGYTIGNSSSSVPLIGHSRESYEDYFFEDRSSPEKYARKVEIPVNRRSMDVGRLESNRGRAAASSSSSSRPVIHAKRRSSNRDEFDGSVQYLDKNAPDAPLAQEIDLPRLETSLYASEQDELLNKVNDCLSKCAFDFIAKFQFPIPLEPDKRSVSSPGDREWTEWVHLLKRLATKRRIPARVLYNGQIKQFVTVLENSSEMRHAAKHQSRPLKDDRNVLQLISAGTQVAKILKDGPAMEYLDILYTDTERLISSRKGKARISPPSRQATKRDL